MRADRKEGWAPKNWCFWTVVLEKTLESSLDSTEIKPVSPEGNQPEHSLEDWCWGSNTLATWCEEPTAAGSMLRHFYTFREVSQGFLDHLQKWICSQLHSWFKTGVHYKHWPSHKGNSSGTSHPEVLLFLLCYSFTMALPLIQHFSPSLDITWDFFFSSSILFQSLNAQLPRYSYCSW